MPEVMSPSTRATSEHMLEQNTDDATSGVSGRSNDNPTSVHLVDLKNTDGCNLDYQDKMNRKDTYQQLNYYAKGDDVISDLDMGQAYVDLFRPHLVPFSKDRCSPVSRDLISFLDALRGIRGTSPAESSGQ